jgi:hypothetical protein
MVTVESVGAALRAWRDALRPAQLSAAAARAADAALSTVGLGSQRPLPPLSAAFSDPDEVAAAAPRNTLWLALVAFGILLVGNALNTALGVAAAALRQRLLSRAMAAEQAAEEAAEAAAVEAEAKARRTGAASRCRASRNRACVLAPLAQSAPALPLTRAALARSCYATDRPSPRRRRLERAASSAALLRQKRMRR